MPIRPQRYDNFLKNAIKRKILSLYILMKHSFARYLCLLAMLFFSAAGFADDFTLKGKVVDEDGQALELVTVSCLAQGKVAMTNLKGEFSISLNSADSVEVRFSMVGYGPRKRVFRRRRAR